MTLIWIVCILTGTAEEIIQTASLYSTSITISNDTVSEDLKISINPSNPDDSLLLLASLRPIQFELSEGIWRVDSQFYDIEGWAISTAEKSLTMEAEYLSPGGIVYISVYKSHSRSVSYSIVHESVPNNSCKCSGNGVCQNGVCVCDIYYKGTKCLLNLEDFSMNSPFLFHLDEQEWQFFKVNLDEAFNKVDFEGSLDGGTPFIFLDQDPDDTNPPPSMLDFSVYIYFHEENTFCHRFSRADSKYWLMGVYCQSSTCDFSLKVTGSSIYDDGLLWIMVTCVITIGIFCFMLPFIVKLILKCRSSSPVVQDISKFMAPEQMEQLYPAIKWEQIEKQELESCSICLEDYKSDTKVRVLTCGHVFHAPCIDSWASAKANCPLCKQDIEPGTPTIQRPTENLQIQ